MTIHWCVLFSPRCGVMVRQLLPAMLESFIDDGWSLWGEYPSYLEAVNSLQKQEE